MKYKLTIVILTHNSAGIVNNLVDALLIQDFKDPYEVIFMDNSSTDDTVKYLEATPFKNKTILNVPRGEFSHSGTRMKATLLAEGELMVFFTDDIIPLGKSFLSNLVKPVMDGAVSASYGVFQIDPEKHDPIDAYMHNKWFREVVDVVGPVPEFCWNYFPPDFQRKLCNFDNCSSCISREVLMELEFPPVPYGADMLFAKNLLRKNGKIAIAKDAKVIHWHKVSFSYLMKRMCIDQYLSIPEFNVYYIRRKLGVIKAILLRSLQRTFIALFKIKIPFRKKLYWAFYNIKILTADFLGKYIGTLNEDSIKGFSPVNKRLLKKQKEIISEIYAKSIKRY